VREIFPKILTDLDASNAHKPRNLAALS
jgi:hypothetical protein